MFHVPTKSKNFDLIGILPFWIEFLPLSSKIKRNFFSGSFNCHLPEDCSNKLRDQVSTGKRVFMRIYMLLFFILCSSVLMAMEMEKKAPERGLTIEDGTSLLHRNARVYVLEDGTIKILFFGLLVGDALFTVMPGLVLALPFSLNTCPKIFGASQNGSFVAEGNSTLAINGTSDADPNPVSCYFGLGLLSVPALSYLSTLLIFPLGKLYQQWAWWMNERIGKKIDRELVKSRLKDEILDDDDIQYLGNLIFIDKDLLQKLSVSQSLILPEIDFNKFRENNRNFSPLAQQYAQKLFRFLE